MAYLSEREEITQRIVSCMLLALSLLAFVFALINFFTYVCRMRGKKPIIILFYCFVFLSTTTTSMLAITTIVDPNFVFSDYERSHYDDYLFARFYPICKDVNAVSFAGLYWSIGISMYQLGISLSIIFH